MTRPTVADRKLTHRTADTGWTEEEMPGQGYLVQIVKGLFVCPSGAQMWLDLPSVCSFFFLNSIHCTPYIHMSNRKKAINKTMK